ncbi:MAG: pyruvate ferredoxin oxidoreductase [Candidatus Aenigmarchaeota archaeon]|nr:pyruvate ferredoxin oxidoreductase [Candidatus Aenigmarchaeota archaeon]
MMVTKKMYPMTGAQAIAEAMRQINPDVVAAYPITPQTPIIENFAKFVADGRVDTEYIRVESEHSAMSATVGAAAAGGRAMTATASAGLALMWEIVYVAASMRLPIIMPIANRALSGPINIHCDHSDTMGTRDSGWIQIYSETAQEAYENMFLALKLAENKNVQLPAMVCLDGFITSHGVENVEIYDDKTMKDFAGEYKPIDPLLDVDNPITYGPLQLQDYYFETKRQQVDAMKNAKKVFLEAGKELSKITGNDYGYFEKYMMDDAEAVIVVMNSTAGNVKSVVDEMRKDGKKVGLLKLRLFRPFPYEEVAEALHKIPVVGVFDRAESFGACPPLYGEIRNALFDSEKKPKMQSFVFGLGGRDIFSHQIENVFETLLEGETSGETKYIGCRGC